MTYTPHAYITIADADELLGYTIPSSESSAWIDGTVTDEIKTQALYDASYYFDSLPWVGFKEEPNQSYAFPRVGLPGQYDGDRRDELKGSSVGVVNGILPYPVGIALALTAAHFADRYLNKSADPDDLLGMGLKTIEVGSMKMEVMGQNEARQKLPDAAEIYLAAYLRRSPNGRGLREVRFI